MPITLDLATNGGLSNPSGGSKTYSHTCSGSDRKLIVGAFGSTTDVFTGCTYAGVAMNLIAKDVNGDRWCYAWELYAPATGANDVVITASASGAIYSGAISYNGVKQASGVDNFLVEKNPPSGVGTITPVADSCWVLMVCRGVSGGMSAGAGTTTRVNGGANGFMMVDKNAVISPAAATSLTINSSGTNRVFILVSLEPETGAATGQPIAKRHGGVPYTAIKAPGRGSSGPWGRTKDGLIVPRRLAA